MRAGGENGIRVGWGRRPGELDYGRLREQSVFLPILNQFIAHAEDNVLGQARDNAPELIHLTNVNFCATNRTINQLAVDDGRFGHLPFHHAAAHQPQLGNINRDWRQYLHWLGWVKDILGLKSVRLTQVFQLRLSLPWDGWSNQDLGALCLGNFKRQAGPVFLHRRRAQQLPLRIKQIDGQVAYFFWQLFIPDFERNQLADFFWCFHFGLLSTDRTAHSRDTIAPSLFGLGWAYGVVLSCLENTVGWTICSTYTIARFFMNHKLFGESNFSTVNPNLRRVNPMLWRAFSGAGIQSCGPDAVGSSDI